MATQGVRRDGVWRLKLAPGEYGKVNGAWVACAPTGHSGYLTDHEIVEHADGTITVTPSLLLDAEGEEQYHGTLTRGVWDP